MKVIVVYGPGSRDLGTVGEAPHRTGPNVQIQGCIYPVKTDEWRN